MRYVVLGVLWAFVGVGIVILILGAWPILTGNKVFYTDPIYDLFLTAILVTTVVAFLLTRWVRRHNTTPTGGDVARPRRDEHRSRKE